MNYSTSIKNPINISSETRTQENKMKNIGFVLLGLFNLYQVNAAEAAIYEKFNCKGLDANEQIVTVNIDFQGIDETNIWSEQGVFLFEKDYIADQLEADDYYVRGTSYENKFQSGDFDFEISLTKKVYRVNFITGILKIMNGINEIQEVELTCDSSTYFEPPVHTNPHWPPGAHCPRCPPPSSCHMTAAGCL